MHIRRILEKIHTLDQILEDERYNQLPKVIKDLKYFKSLRKKNYSNIKKIMKFLYKVTSSKYNFLYFQKKKDYEIEMKELNKVISDLEIDRVQIIQSINQKFFKKQSLELKLQNQIGVDEGLNIIEEGMDLQGVMNPGIGDQAAAADVGAHMMHSVLEMSKQNFHFFLEIFLGILIFVAFLKFFQKVKIFWEKRKEN